MQQWIKRGLVFKPTYNFPWMRTHAWVPTIEHLQDDIFKIYFGSRNADNLTQPGFFTFDINTLEILSVSKDPILTLGPLGSFDDSNVGACTLVIKDHIHYLYYVGWMQGKRVRYYPTIGLGISKDGGQTFTKYSQAPLLHRTDNDPFGMASPFVLYDDGIWKMWYASYRRWDLRDGEPWPQYEIRYAESENGLDWQREDKTCLGSEYEEAVARPWVLKEDGIYKMWYCYRIQGGTYRIGYAESEDGKQWERKDEAVGIDVSPSGWDSEMIAYPCVFTHKGKRYMLYNGNQFGIEGIGLAEATL